MEAYINFKKHICSDCIKSGIKCEMSDSDIDNCIWAMDPGDN